MDGECENCHGTGKCPQCLGTARFGYPGFGRPENYRFGCVPCRDSGVCQVCHGSGQHP
jgi:hypothetical protein